MIIVQGVHAKPNVFKFFNERRVRQALTVAIVYLASGQCFQIGEWMLITYISSLLSDYYYTDGNLVLVIQASLQLCGSLPLLAQGIATLPRLT